MVGKKTGLENFCLSEIPNHIFVRFKDKARRDGVTISYEEALFLLSLEDGKNKFISPNSEYTKEKADRMKELGLVDSDDCGWYQLSNKARDAKYDIITPR